MLLEGGPTLAGAFVAAGAVDKVVGYLAPVLLGAGPAALADAGISTIAQALRLDVTETVRIGPDLRITAVPAATCPEGAAEVFTGIVEELGEVTAVENLGDASRFRLRGPVVTEGAKHGDSIAVNGVCLTVVEHERRRVHRRRDGRDPRTAPASARSTAGSRVNLERPMAVGGRLGGHIVQGHVDGTGTILERKPSENWEIVKISLPAGPRPATSWRRAPSPSTASASPSSTPAPTTSPSASSPPPSP